MRFLDTSTLAQHRICATRIDPDIVNPLAQKALTYPLWIDRNINPKGITSSAIPCLGFRKKTLLLSSSKEGDVQVEIDPAGLDRWHIICREKVAKGDIWKFTTDDGFARLRMRFAPSEEANVSAWIILERS
ncbi:MAG: hypothetical protein ACUVTL_10915 [Thermoproteota archaeon]